MSTNQDPAEPTSAEQEPPEPVNDQQDQVDPGPDLEISTGESEALPLLIGNTEAKPKKARLKQNMSRLILQSLAIVIFLLIGAAVGIYTQPDSAEFLMEKTGIESERFSDYLKTLKRPQAEASAEPAPPKSHSVVALGKLVPDGDITTVAMPYGAADARINSLQIKIGQRVSRGDTLAILDNRSFFQSTVKTTRANLALKQAMLNQTRSSIAVSIKEANAAIARAQITAQMTRKSFKRQEQLFEQAVISASALDDASLKMQEAQRDLEKAEASLLRYKSSTIDEQPDVQVAVHNLRALQAELNRAEQDLSRSVVSSPLNGTVIDIHVRPGEKPGNSGIADIADTDHMTAELEVYQADIASIKVGQHVKLSSDAIKTPLKGKVSTIGYLVGRQTQLGNDPAANTDARVIKVTVQLDPASSAQATRLTFLEVTARISIADRL